MKKNYLKQLIAPFVFFLLTLIYVFPLLQGLILLPLDLLISNYAPWYQPGTILLKNPYMQDSVIQLYPWKHLVFESLTHGVLPFWNPYQHLGLPFMATLKPMVFYPLNVFFVFGEITAWHALLFSQLFLAMLFAYYLARELGLKMLHAILVGFAFGLNSYMMGLLQFGSDAHTIIWWPALLLFAKRYLDKQQGRYLLFLGVTLTISIFAGQLQYLAYFLIFLAAFIFVYGRSLHTKVTTYLLLSSAILLGFGIAAIQLLPAIELFGYSHRGLLSAAQNHEVFARGLITPDKLFRLFSPDFFGNPVTRDLTIGYIETSGYFGIIPLFFTLFAIVFARKILFVKIFTWTFVLSLLFSLQGIGELLYLLKLPLITSGQADRIFTLVLFSGAFLAGFGVSEFVAMKDRKKRLVGIIFFAALFILVLGSSYIAGTFASLEDLLRSVKFPTLILGFFCFGSFMYLAALSRKKRLRILATIFLIFVLALTFFDLFRLGYRFLTFSNEKFLYPDMGVTKFIQATSQKNLSRTFGLTEPELGTYLQIYTVETYNPLYLERTGMLLQALQKLPPEQVSIDNKYFLNSKGAALKRTMDFVGVHYIVANKDENPSESYFGTPTVEKELKKIYTDDRYSVYENSTAYPRFALYYQTETIHEHKKLLSRISDGKTDLRTVLLLDEPVPQKIERGSGSARLLASTGNRLVFEVESTKDGLFYLSDTYYPGWQATVNKEPTKIYRAQYNFRAVVVPHGTSVVEFTYLPTSFLFGAGVSVVSLVILLLLALKPKRITRHD